MDVLWIDDDSPGASKMFDDIRVFPVQSCGQATSAIDSGEVLPKWVIMDLIVPQDGWGKGYLKVPGIEFTRYLKDRYGDEVEVVVYTVVLDEQRRLEAIKSGALEVFEKTRFGFLDVIDNIRKRSKRKGLELLSEQGGRNA